MFLILNTTNQLIIIGDLSIKIKAKLVIDLDKVCTRSIADGSQSLRNMINSGAIKVLQKTKKHKKAEPVTLRPINNSEDVSKQIKSLKKELRDEIKRLQEGGSKEVMDQLNNLTDILSNKEFKNITVNKIQQVVAEDKNKIDEPVDLDTLTKIGELAMNKMMDKSVANIKSDKKIKDNKINVKNIVADLEELI